MTKRDRRLLGLSCAALALVIAVQYMILPAMEEKAALEEQLQTLTQTRESWESRLHALSYLDEAIAQHEAEFAAASAAYPPCLSAEEMDAAVTSLLLKYGLFPRTLTLTEGQAGTLSPYLAAEKSTPKDTQYLYIGSAALTAAGTAENWLKLLDEISVHHPYLRVASFTIAGSGDSAEIRANVEFYMGEGE